MLDLTGRVFGRLTVIGNRVSYNWKSYWECKCECGTVKHIQTQYLTTGDTRSCGCLGKDRSGSSNPNYKHGLVDSPEYKAWANMHQRCSNPTADAYPWYGGRGIAVCAEWSDFAVFIEDMGRMPASNYTIDRKDPNGFYCKENCCWVTKRHQQQNKRNNVLISAYGKTKIESVWAEELGVFRTSIQSRRNRGYSGDILLAPSRNMLDYAGPRCVKYMEDYTKEELQQFRREAGSDGRQD